MAPLLIQNRRERLNKAACAFVVAVVVAMYAICIPISSIPYPLVCASHFKT